MDELGQNDETLDIVVARLATAAATNRVLLIVDQFERQGQIAEERLAQFEVVTGNVGADRLLTMAQELAEAGDHAAAAALLRTIVGLRPEPIAELQPGDLSELHLSYRTI